MTHVFQSMHKNYAHSQILGMGNELGMSLNIIILLSMCSPTQKVTHLAILLTLLPMAIMV